MPPGRAWANTSAAVASSSVRSWPAGRRAPSHSGARPFAGDDLAPPFQGGFSAASAHSGTLTMAVNYMRRSSMRYQARHARRKKLGAALSAAGVIAGLLAGDAIGAAATSGSLASVDVSNP